MSTHLELLPAVDIADGQAVQLVQGVAGSEKRFGDPVEAALRWQEAGAEWIHLVDLDAAFGRGHNRELQAKIVGILDIRVEMSGGIRDDESLGRGDGRRLPAGQHRHRGARAARVVRSRHRRARRPGGRRARRTRADAGGARVDPRGRATSTTCWPGSTPRVARATWSPTSTRTACSRARTSSCCATSAPRPTGRWSPPAASPSSADLEALQALVSEGVEGAIVGTALYEGRFTLEDALALTLPSKR